MNSGVFATLDSFCSSGYVLYCFSFRTLMPSLDFKNFFTFVIAYVTWGNCKGLKNVLELQSVSLCLRSGLLLSDAQIFLGYVSGFDKWMQGKPCTGHTHNIDTYTHTYMHTHTHAHTPHTHFHILSFCLF